MKGVERESVPIANDAPERRRSGGEARSDKRVSAAGEGRGDKRPLSQPGLLDRLRSLFGIGGASVRDDIEDALDDTGASDAFSAQEQSLLRNVLRLHEIQVDDIMVPRADVIAVGAAMTLHDVLAAFRESGHSRLPVHGDTLDDPRGMVHVRDFVELLAGPQAAGATSARAAPADLSVLVGTLDVVRPVLFVPPSMPALDLLVRMQASRTHMALVIDEYGGTDGLVTIEDIVEMIVGDIEDEHDEGEQVLVEAAADGSFTADGRASLEEVSAALGTDLASAADADEFDTVGGLVTSVAGRVPHRGEVVPILDAFDIEILDADPRRIKRIRIRRRGPPVADRVRDDPAFAPDGVVARHVADPS